MRIIILIIQMFIAFFAMFMLGRSSVRLFLGRAIVKRIRILKALSDSENLSYEKKFDILGQIKAFDYIIDCIKENARKDPLYRFMEKRKGVKKT